MATQVDERVVSMKFDNADFEKRSRQTLKSLHDLDDATKNMNGAKGLEGLAKAAKEVDLTHIEKQASVLEVKFSALQVVAITTLQRITNAAITAGKNLAKSLTITPVTTGFNEYELKMGSIQTIMAATGESIETVNKYLDELNEYSDKTIYSFSDMTQNIGKFTNAGVKLDKAVAAIKGVSNVAAVSGANANEASRAMYNFAQALSAGYVKLIDWKSIENANMATVEFKNQLIDTALQLGTVTKSADGMYKTLTGKTFNATKNFNEVLQEQWMTTDVLVQTLSNYASETTDIGKKAYASAQDVKTFSMLLDTLKEAAQSGWAQTYELVIGNFEEAKSLWTRVNDVVSKMIARSADERNATLAEWKALGGRDSAIKALAAAWKALAAVVTPIRDAFREMFPPATGEALYSFTENVRKLTESLTLSAEAAYTLKVVMKAILLPFKLVFKAVDLGVYVLGLLISKVWKLVDSFLAIPSKAIKVQESIRQALGDTRYTVITAALSQMLANIKSGLDFIVTSAKNLVTYFTSGEAKELLDWFEDVKKDLEPIKNTLLDELANGLAKLAGINLRATTASVVELSDTVEEKAGGAVSSIQGLFSIFKKKPDTSGMDKVATSVATVSRTASDISLRELIYQFQSGTLDIPDLLISIGDAAVDMVKNLTPAKILIFSFGVTLTKLMAQFSLSGNIIAKAIETLAKGVADGIGGMVKALTDLFFNLSSILGAIKLNIARGGYKKVAVAIAILAGALLVVSFIDPSRVLGATGAIIALMIAMNIMMTTMMRVENKLGGQRLADMLKAMALTIGAVALSVLALANAMKTISELTFGQAVGGFLGVIGLLATIAGAVFVINKIAPTFSIGAASLIGIAVAMALVTRSVVAMSKIDTSGLNDTFKYFLSVIATLGLVSELAKGLKVRNAIALIGVIFSYITAFIALRILAELDTSKILEGIVNLIPIIMAIGAMTLAVGVIPKGFKTVNLISTAISVLILAKTIESIGQINIGAIARGTLVVGALIVLLGLFTQLSMMPFWGTTAKMTGNFIGLSIAIGVMALSIKLLAGLSLEEIAAGTAVMVALLGMLSVFALASKGVSKAATTILALTVCITTLTVVLAMLTLIPVEDLLPAAEALGIILVSLGAAIMMFGKLNGKLRSAIPAAITMGVLLALFTACMTQLEGIGALQESASILASMTTVVVGLGVLCAGLKNMQKMSIKDYLPIVATLGLIMVEIGLIMVGLQKWIKTTDGLYEKVGALTLVLVGISGAMVIISNMKSIAGQDVKGVLAIMATMLFGCSVALGILGGWPDLNNLIEKASALSILMIGLGVATAILGQFKGSFIAALEALKIIGIVLAAMTVIFALLGGVAKWLGDDIDIFDKGIDLLVKIGEGIGKFVGSIFGGFAEGLMGDGLQDIANQINAFMSSFSAFVEQAKLIDDTLLSKTKIIADTIAIMTGITYGDTPEMLVFGAALPALGNSIVSYYSVLSSIEDYVKGNSVTRAFSDLVESLPDDFSVLQSINTATFALSMQAMGNGITSFYSAVSAVEMDDTKMSNAVDQTKKVIELVKGIPKTGGLIDDIVGTANASTFAESMFQLGTGIRRYYVAATYGNSDYALLGPAITATKDIISALDEIPLTDGGIQKLFGQRNIGGFARHLGGLGMGIHDFYANVTSGNVTIDEGIMESAAKGLTSIIESVNGIEETGSIFEWFTGKKDISGFASQLSNLGQGVADFYNAVVGAGVFVDGTENSTTGLDKIMEFIELVKGLEDAIIEARSEVERQASSLVNLLKSTIRGKYSDIKKAGEYLMEGFIAGVKKKEADAKTEMENFANGVTTSAQETLDEHSPSKVFQKIGEFVVQGFCNGVKNTQHIANDGMVKMGVGILKATQNYFQIHSPSALMRDEVGVWIVKGIAEGITSDMSAEEAAEKKGENIKKAFQSGMDKVELDMKTDDLELQLWKAMHPDATEEDIKKHEQEKLKKDLENQADKVNTMNAQYATFKKEFGEDAQQTQEAYNSYVEEKISFIEIANELMESLGINEEQETARMVYFAQEMAANQENLLKAGFTMEQIKTAIAERTGYNLNGVAEGVAEGFDSLESIMAKYLVDADVTIEKSVAQSIGKGITKGTQQVVAQSPKNGQAIANSLVEQTTQSFLGVDTTNLEASIGQMFEGSAMNGIDGIITAIDSGGVDLVAKGKEMAKQLIGGYDEETETNSPSKVMYQRGVWLVEGLINGINASAPLAYNAMANLVNGSTFAYSNAGTGLVSGMSDGITNGEVNTLGTMTEFLKNVLTQIDSNQVTFYTAGDNLTKNLCDGMTNGFTTYFEAVTNAVTSALTKLEQEVKMRADSIAQSVSQALTQAAQIGVSGSLVPVVEAGQNKASTGAAAASIKTPAYKKNFTQNLAKGTQRIVSSATGGGAVGAVARTAAGMVAGTVINNFTQNNTSPKALSRTEIYRDFKNFYSRVTGSSTKTGGGKK